MSHMFKPVIQKNLIYHYQDVSLADRSNGPNRTISVDRKYGILYTVGPEIILPRDWKMFQVIYAASNHEAKASDKNI